MLPTASHTIKLESKPPILTGLFDVGIKRVASGRISYKISVGEKMLLRRKTSQTVSPCRAPLWAFVTVELEGNP